MPSESCVAPLIGCAADALEQLARAARVEPGETISSALTAAVAADDAYHGSVPRRGYAESSVTECSTRRVARGEVLHEVGAVRVAVQVDALVAERA